jgi:hypothetical protein
MVNGLLPEARRATAIKAAENPAVPADFAAQ